MSRRNGKNQPQESPVPASPEVKEPPTQPEAVPVEQSAGAAVVGTLSRAVEAAADALGTDGVRAAVFRAIARGVAVKHLDFLDRVVAGTEMDTYAIPGVGVMQGPPSLQTRIAAYKALTAGGVLKDDAMRLPSPGKGGKAVLVIPVDTEG